MTWGQLRLQLQLSGPDLPLDLIDAYLNSRYEQVLESSDWTGLKAHATIQTTAAYQTGTVTLTVGSTTATGSGTTWTAGMTGRQLYRPGDRTTYTVTYVSATSFTLDRPYEGFGSDADGTVYADADYVVMQNVYTLPEACREIVTLINPITGLPMPEFSKDELDRSSGPRCLIGDPNCYAVYDDSTESTLPVLHQIELYPPPQYARGLQMEYTKATLGFSGENTTSAPLPWVSSTILLYGCRADIATWLKDFNSAKMYEAKFQEELARLLRIEHQQRRKIRPLGMAGRFTRHRLARATRTFSRGWGSGQGGAS